MAKKIRLDFSKVEERSGYNSRQMPEGLYEARVISLEQKEAQDGTAMLVYGLQPTQQKYATRNFPYFCKLQQNQLWKLRDLFVAAGETIPKKVTQIDPEAILKGKVVIEVGDGSGQYSDRSEIVSVYPLSTLEDLTGDEDDDEFDDSDEELDDEDFEDEDDSDEEEYEDDDEDLDEDDEDDEDLDDDEVYDDEDEDDEEEEPAPKRAPARKPAAKKAPAKKAPAKKAAAPAKRVVKRRR